MVHHSQHKNINTIMIKKYVEFLNEEVNSKIIYFFHPKLTYDSRVESQSIELINLYFDNPVIYNTPDLKGGYYKYADDVNIIIVLPYPDGSIAPKTVRRIAYAFDRGVKAYYIHPKKYKIIGIENIEFFTEREKSIEDIEMNNTSIDDYFTDNE